MKKTTFFRWAMMLTALSIASASLATQSVGYKLWDSNNGYTATLTPSDLGAAMVQHVQIKFDDAITIVADSATLVEQFQFSLSGRAVDMSVNALDGTILDITMTSGSPQASSVMQIKAVSADSIIAGIHDSQGNAVKLIPINSIQPTGLALEKVDSVIGTAETPASVTYRMSSIPLVRSMNFLQAQSTVSENPDGYLAREYFTIHSHSYNTMTALTHFTTLTATTNVDTLQKVGYTFELIDGDDADNPYIKLTALAPVAGEELSWIVYHYPYRSAADGKFDLAVALDNSLAEQSVIDAAKAILYDLNATPADIAEAITALGTVANGIYTATAGDDVLVKSVYYTLLGSRIAKPTTAGLYIRQDIYLSGKTIAVKVME
jgi:hypothetical protein